MKIFNIFLLALILTVPLYAVTVEEEISSDNVKITITFTKDEFDLFILDKASPREWIRNICQVNVDGQRETIQKDMINFPIMLTEENIRSRVNEKKIERNNKLRKQKSGIIYD